ncbi:hypothetical protein HNP38_003131 [Chryseobacterium defluvii]|uniref:Uncharacterized protein n=1 Tax=Chryseobacterium defluvii TaxID=160396 RepID=A0A840KGL6_9FLAO|nr:hypothetical protein [Chryseobacterium defluvii]MBB4807815.1 hypothetical protein [Chryseobacterium defluvii]
MTSCIFGAAQEKKISFAKELNYQMTDKNKPLSTLKMYASPNSEFLTKLNLREFPMYYYTDGLGTSVVSLEMNNRISGSLNNLMYFGFDYGYEDKEEFTLETEKLNTKETVLGIPCSHYLISYRSKTGEKKKNDDLKLCIDDKSPFNNFSVLTGLLNQYMGKSRLKSFGMNGLILKAGPGKTYDKEHFILTSVKDSKDFVYFDHKKAMTDQQRKMDSLMLVYKNYEDEYTQMDSAAVVDSAAMAVKDAMADYMNDIDNNYYIPEYTSEYKKAKDEEGSLAISNIPDEKLWKGLPSHCKNFEKDLPEFKNKELKKHLGNYVGQMCDMYLTQAETHNVGIKITLDEIRREVLYLNTIHDKLDESDQKKLNNYLKNLD